MKIIKKNFKLRRQLPRTERSSWLVFAWVQVLTTAAIISALIATLSPFYSYKRTSEPKLHTHCKNEIHLYSQQTEWPSKGISLRLNISNNRQVANLLFIPGMVRCFPGDYISFICCKNKSLLLLFLSLYRR